MKQLTIDGKEFVQLFLPYDESDECTWGPDGIQFMVCLSDLIDLFDPAEVEDSEDDEPVVCAPPPKTKNKKAPVKKPVGAETVDAIKKEVDRLDEEEIFSCMAGAYI